jgi:hypothetical protein
MGPIVIVLLDPEPDRRTRLFDAAIFVHPDFLLLQAAMEPFDAAVSFRVKIRRSAVRDAEPRKHLHEARRSELRSVVCGQRQVRITIHSLTNSSPLYTGMTALANRDSSFVMFI